MTRELSSYRDPDGYVTYVGDEVRRYVLNDNSPVLLPAYKKFFDRAVREGLLVPFEQLDQSPRQQGSVLKLNKLPLVSYPYEWGFEQLKEAALVTLDIGLLALEHGLSLKDATAFNIQQYKGKMVFIDHTSFEETDGLLPWRSYSQFCRHFIAPLLVTSKTGRNANKQFLISLDGMDLGQAGEMLPLLARFSPSAFVHIYLHNMMINGFKDTRSESKIKAARSGSQKAYLEHLRGFVKSIPAPKYDTEWHDYYNNTNYNDASFHEKEKIIDEIMGEKRRSCVWDLGGNNGHFSRIMAEQSDMVVSMDIDYAAVDLNWLKNKQTGCENVYPLVMDLTNPSPALGFGNAERKTIDERSRPEIMFALAIVHHLSVTYNVPFAMIAQRLQQNGAELAIEYVDREDSQFKKLLRSKGDDYPHYTRENFEKSFYQWFDVIKKYDIPNAHRTLYHLSPKK